jgi:hypothetical protein
MSSFALDLAGWSELSIYGWDPLDATWWAQLWPDGSRSDEPEMWLGYVPPIRTLGALAQQVAAATGVDAGQVGDALRQAGEALETGGGAEAREPA